MTATVEAEVGDIVLVFCDECGTRAVQMRYWDWKCAVCHTIQGVNDADSDA